MFDSLTYFSISNYVIAHRSEFGTVSASSMLEGLDGRSGIHYSLKELAHYLSHLNFGLFIKIRPIINYK